MFKPISACCPLLALSLVAVPATATAQQSKWAAPDDSIAKSLIQSERRWAEAACDGNLDLQGFVADDFYGTAPDGSRYTKAEEVAHTKNPTHHYRDCRLGPVKVHFYGNSLALLYGSESRIPIQSSATSQTQTLIWTDTWINRNGKWQIIAAQDTFAPEKH
jgi:Domain of unknown function (DUF4440)